MRTFIILLLLANISYFGWNQGWLRESQQRLQPAAPVASGAGTGAAAAVGAPAPAFVPAPQGLVLLSELTEAQRRALGPGAEGPGGPGPGGIAPMGGEPSELAGLQAAAGSQPDEEQDPVTPPASNPWCAELGPFEAPEAASALLPRLGELGVSARLQAREVPVSSTFWVYLPAFADEAGMRSTLAELQSRNIDSYYMRSGQFAGGISLGVFSRRASAESVQAGLARQGYEAQIGEVFREESRTFLMLRAPDAGLLGQLAWAEFRASTQALALAENVCEGVASDF